MLKHILLVTYIFKALIFTYIFIVQHLLHFELYCFGLNVVKLFLEVI